MLHPSRFRCRPCLQSPVRRAVSLCRVVQLFHHNGDCSNVTQHRSHKQILPCLWSPIRSLRSREQIPDQIKCPRSRLTQQQHAILRRIAIIKARQFQSGPTSWCAKHSARTVSSHVLSVSSPTGATVAFRGHSLSA